jgi:hypothetical protein
VAGKNTVHRENTCLTEFFNAVQFFSRETFTKFCMTFFPCLPEFVVYHELLNVVHDEHSQNGTFKLCERTVLQKPEVRCKLQSF